MSESALREVLRLLPQLGPTERKVVLGRLELLSDTTSDLQATYLVMTQVLGEAIIPYRAFARSKHFGRFKRGAETLDAFSLRVFGHRDRRVTQRIQFLLIRCVVAGLKESKLPVGPVTIGDGMARIESMVEQSFPGYLEAGLLVDAFLNAVHT